MQPADMPKIIRTQNLEKRYGKVTALRGVTLAVEPGIVGLLGPNGAGKSTLLGVLLGQVPATAGSASVLGFDVFRQQRRIRKRIGFMPENDCLIGGLSGIGYVHYCGRLAGMGHADAMQRAHEVLDYVGLGEARYRPAEEYSAGMKQRLKLAQALVHDPDLLFLDEPTNGMDPQGRAVMLELIRDLGRCGISVLLSSHLLPDVERVCARVIIMGGGEVLTEGDIRDMRAPHPTRYTVRWSGGPGAAFAEALAQRNVAVSATDDQGGLMIELPAPDLQPLVFEAARSAGVRVCGLSPERSSLEAMFMKAIRRQTAA